jgi:chromosome partitioning protein
VGIVYAVANQKGGVGKSTTVVNLGAYLGSRGKKVLCVDIDPQGNTTTGLGIKKKTLTASSYEVLIGKCSIREAIVETAFENISILPAKNTLAGAELELSEMENRMNRLKMQLLTCKAEYDYIFIDCPPALGLLTVNGLVAADLLLIPMLAEFYALEGLSQLTNTIKVVRSQYNPTLDIGGILFVMFDQRLNVSRQVEEEVAKYFPGKVFQTKIPRNVRLSEAPSHGKPVLYYDRLSKGAEAYARLGMELMGEKLPEKKRKRLSFGKKREREEE